ncbi:helix-turn-helix domain-containing protein [Paraburkholderia aspalathi]|uniref:helix-turn-helix domain-containing protein n=1 Tax=Paraburkholderia aspalathi TaxID=1324617 RepID=UPI0038BD2225
MSRKHPHQDFRTRGLSLLGLASGSRVHEAAVDLDVSDTSVYNWAHSWTDWGLCGLLSGHKGGRPLALSDALIATAIEAARAESMALKHIVLRVEEVHGQPLPCRLETLSVALKRARVSYNQVSLATFRHVDEGKHRRRNREAARRLRLKI